MKELPWRSAGSPPVRRHVPPRTHGPAAESADSDASAHTMTNQPSPTESRLSPKSSFPHTRQALSSHTHTACPKRRYKTKSSFFTTRTRSPKNCLSTRRFLHQAPTNKTASPRADIIRRTPPPSTAPLSVGPPPGRVLLPLGQPGRRARPPLINSTGRGFFISGSKTQGDLFQQQRE